MRVRRGICWSWRRRRSMADGMLVNDSFCGGLEYVGGLGWELVCV